MGYFKMLLNFGEDYIYMCYFLLSGEYKQNSVKGTRIKKGETLFRKTVCRNYLKKQPQETASGRNPKQLC